MGKYLACKISNKVISPISGAALDEKLFTFFVNNRTFSSATALFPNSNGLKKNQVYVFGS